MPSYDFTCQDCQRRVTLFYRSFAAYDAATTAGTHTCPHCQGHHLTRRIRRVALGKSEEARFGSLADESTMAALENADPATMAGYLRQVSQDMGEDMGDEFDEVMGRLESGESPESIEANLPDGLGDGLSGGDLGGGLLDG